MTTTSDPPENNQESVIIDPYKNSLSGILKGDVLLKFSYDDYIRAKKLFERDEALRQRSREKAKQNCKTNRERIHKKPIEYEVVSSLVLVEKQ